MSAAQGLTALSLNNDNTAVDAALGRTQWFAALLPLTGLVALQLSGMHLQQEDLLRLTALTSLRSLCLRRVNTLDEAAAAVLANSLTRLSSLELQSGAISSPGRTLLTVVGGLTGLQRLSLAGSNTSVVGDEELASLSRLAQLTFLSFKPMHCSPGGLRRLRAALPRLKTVE